MKPEPLTPVQIRHIKPPQTGRLDIGDGATPGLCLRVSAHDSWKWTLRMRGPDGGLRRFVLGEFTDVHGLAWARREAEKLRQQVRHQGRDPHHERKERAAAAKAKAERDRLTLGVLVDDWSRLHLTKRSDRYASEAVRALRAAFAKQWGRPAGALDRATARLALDALERPEKAPKRRRGIVGNGRAIADRTCAYGRACFAWAMKREMVAANPFLALPKRETGEARERVLNDAELVAIWRAVASTDAKVFGSIVRLLILTGQRREEVAGIAWPEISTDRRTWTIPANRTKNGKPHLVPLSAAARDVLPEEPERRARVRPGFSRPARHAVRGVVEVQGSTRQGFWGDGLAHPRSAPNARHRLAASWRPPGSHRGRAESRVGVTRWHRGDLPASRMGLGEAYCAGCVGGACHGASSGTQHNGQGGGVTPCGGARIVAARKSATSAALLRVLEGAIVNRATVTAAHKPAPSQASLPPHAMPCRLRANC